MPARLDLSLTAGIVFGPIKFYAKDENDAAVNLTGWTPFAEARTRAGGRLILDLNPSVTDAAAGEVTVPKMTDEQTFDLRPVKGAWSLVMQHPNGDRLGPYFEGSFTIQATATHPPEA